ncbi:MAG: hypothetical protein F6K04_02490 [Leptolyngbya sp. SIO4C5]|nr:hypothetical protein [Leptolyngbya sp. SIO4C5]
MASFWIIDNRWIECIDDKGRLVTMPYRRFLRMNKRRAEKADRALGVQRNRIPLQHIEIPDHPEAPRFLHLAAKIEKIAHSIPVNFESKDAAVWMRCVQCYWNAKAYALAYRICPLSMPDPLAEGGPIQQHLLPPIALRNLRLDIDADENWYRLVMAGEPYVRQWAEKNGHKYTFSTAEELFLETLKIGFETDLTEGILCPDSPNWTRKQKRDHYRQWLQFLNDHFNGASKEAKFEAILMTMSWKGYALSALRPLKLQKPFDRLWQRYIKTLRPLIRFQDTAIYWQDAEPYQSDTSSSGRRTRQRMKIRSEVTDEGHFIWHKDAGAK